ncbi:DUF3883 domain-containing protein [Hymenobacter aquaticus]|uniref:DUF3883 domain-containing protein n=1 Tax=Hymenobacter aquaticus TaxID=1867101 RepID=A0A4Z0Q714_9BACT|nr:DUF3883 domain-containing protein [Hymenobacter aquaticus]TGE25209.1 DUF3883 domain-containing protein [Hymenobacter aquaticus]
MAKHQSLQQFVEKKMQERLDVYRRDPILILQDYMLEQQVSADYDGRQLLELLQNADDAAGRDPKKRAGQVSIRLQGRILEVANTGAIFTEAGVQSLLYSNLSPKSLDADQIGAKGLGFRAVLSWSDRLEIHSGQLRIAFSAAYARKVLQQLRSGDNKQAVLRMLRLAREETTTAEHPIAVLRCAELLGAETEPRAGLAGYNTLIRVHMKAEQLPALRQQLVEELLPEALVFLPHLTLLHVECDGVGWHMERAQSEGADGVQHVRVTRQEADGARTRHNWQVLARTDCLPAPEDKALRTVAATTPYEVKVAWKADLAPGPGRLFSYFRTGVDWPLPCLVHATFNLNASRQSLQPTATNRMLLSEAAQLLVEAAEVMARSRPADPYLPLRLLWHGAAKDWDFHAELSTLGFEVALTQALRKAAVFPVISGHYRRFSEIRLLAQPFACYLPPLGLDELLCWPLGDNQTVVLAGLTHLLTRLGPTSGSYPLPALLARVAAARPAGATDDFTRYAELLRLVEAELRSRPAAQLQLQAGGWPALLIDQAGRALSPGQVSFLPPDGECKLGMAGLNVLHPALSAALLQAFALPTYQALSGPLSLPAFNVRPYEFAELALYVLRQHGQRVKTLHPMLFRLYQAERVRNGRGQKRQPVPSLAQDIPLPTQAHGTAPGCTLYFSRNPDNTRSLCADLYAHDPERLVGSRAALGLGGTRDKDGEVRSYLEWCGVREWPRWVVESSPGKAYVDHALRRFDYRRTRLGGHRYDGYVDFRKVNPPGKDRCYVASLDGLDGILSHADPAAILRWVWESPTQGLADVLKKDREPTSVGLPASFLQAGQYNYHPVLNASQMPAYVRWKFATSKWLPGPNEERVAPQRMLLPARGQQDGEFSPVLYGAAPSQRLLQQKKITEGLREARELLTSLGVNLALSELPAELLYQVLLELPQRNPKGDRASSLYRELATNLEASNLSDQDPAREEFIRRGQVWCTAPGGSRYVPLASNQVRYAADATYSPRLLARFILLDVPPKRNADKMLRLFGVPPLDRLASSVVGSPPIHPLREAFAQDWQLLLLYLYALLPQNTVIADKGDVLKSLRVQLTTQLRVAHTLSPGSSDTESYAPYAYLLTPNKLAAWIVVPEDVSLATLKQQPRFQDALAEILSVLLEADALREVFMRFIAAPAAQRDELLALRQGATLEQVHATLHQVREVMTQPAENRQLFWLHLASLARPKGKAIRRAPVREAEWPAWLRQTFGTRLSALVLAAFSQLNPSLPWQHSDLRVLFQLFGALGLSAAVYNRRAAQPVDFSLLFQAEYDELIARYEPFFEQQLYAQLATATLREQRGFEAARVAYRALRVPVPIPSDFAAETVFRQQVLTRWHVTLTGASEAVDLSERAAEHERTLVQRAVARGFAPDYVRDFVSGTLERRSLLLFGRVTELLSKLPKPTVQTNTGQPIRNVFAVGNSDVAFDTAQDLLGQLLTRWQGHDTTIHLLNIEALPEPTNEARERGGIGTSGGAGRGYQRPEDQALTGAIGEGLAYEALRRRPGVRLVEIKSENAVKLGRLPGQKGLGYDLTYIDEQGLHYVEVKTSTVAGNRQFYMSQNEVQFGEQHPGNYEVLLVTGIQEATGPRYESLGNPFVYSQGQGFLHNPRFTVEHDTFRVRFQEVRQAI